MRKTFDQNSTQLMYILHGQDHELFSDEALIFAGSPETNSIYLDMIGNKLILFGDLYESKSIEDEIDINYGLFCGKKLKESEN